MTRIFTLLPLLLCSGCGASDQSDNGEDSGPPVDGMIPVEGAYTTTATLADNNCGGHALLESSFTSSVSAASLETYSLMFEFIEENLQFDCTLSLTDFECSAATTEDYADWGWAAVADFSHSYSGTWSTESSFSGDLSTEVNCAGSECDGLAGVLEIEFPCTTTHSIDAVQD